MLVISLAGTANAATGHTGGIALSWDDAISIDSCYQNLQLFENYNATCTINVNSNDLINSGQDTKDNLNALHVAGWEVAAHGHNHEDSIAFLNNHTRDEWLSQEIFPNIIELTNSGYPVYSIAYAYGSRNETTDAILAQYFRTLRSSEFETMEGGQDVNETPEAYYKWDDAQLVYAVEIDDNSGVSLESIKGGIDYAIQNEFVLLLYGHTITPTVTGDYQTSTSKLEEILNYTKEQGGEFYLLGELGNSSWTPSSPGSSNVTANFTVSKDSVLVGENVIFVDYSVNQTSETLDFGDGSPVSSTANAVHAYTTPGTYTVTLTVTNGVSTHSMTRTIMVTPAHKGGIALSWDDVQNVGSCYENLQMFQQYNANCTMNLNKLSDWGQGTTDNLSTLQDAGWEIATHGYNHEDSIAFLNNHTSDEWLNQEIFPNIVELTGYGYPAYSLAYPYSSRNDTTDALLAPYFRTLRSTAFGVVNVNETSDAYYKWDDTPVVYAVEIDDQTNVSLESVKYGIDYAIQNGYVLVLYGHAITPTVTGDYQTSTSRLNEILSYTYQNNGAFYLMKDLGNSSWEQWSPRFSNVTANFTVSKNSVLVGESVTFVDYSVNQTSERLNFGDGSNSTNANVVHTYTKAGTYNATLTVSNDVSSQSITRKITVLQPTVPVASFTSNPTSGTAPLNVTFIDTSTGSPASWSWNFGDGNTSLIQNPKHTYSTPGSYTVNLTVSNLNGTTSKTATITVQEQEIVLPTAAFTTNVTEGYAPLSVLFTDVSQNAESRSWDVNNDGVEDSKEQSFVYKYAYKGTYTVKLTVSNENGTDSKTAMITAKSGGSSGGGGGGSPEPAKNIEVKEISQTFITNGKPVRFEFAKNATCVVCVSFDAKKTAGKTTTITEQLKGKSALVSELPEGEVYKSFNVWVGNSGYASSNNIENRALCFKVEKAWVKDKKIDQDSIALNRYSDKKWEQFPATLLREDSKYLYFTSEVPGFSSFAITGKANPEEALTEIQPENGSDSPEENKGSEAGDEDESKGIPGFETIYCVLGLFGVFLYKRR